MSTTHEQPVPDRAAVDTPNVLHVLSDEECWDLVRRGSVGRLAVSIANRPDIFPVNFAVDDEGVVVRTAPGTKLAAAALGIAVAFEVEELDEPRRTGASVVLKGTAHEVEGLEELLALDDLGVQPWADGPKHRYLRIEPESVTGRRIGPDLSSPGA